MLKKLLFLLFVGLSLSANALAQKASPPELGRLRDEYAKATRDYKASLQKLAGLYEEAKRKAEDRLAQTKQLYDSNLISIHDVEVAEQAVASAQKKIDEANQQIANADKQIAESLSDVELAARYNRALAEEEQQRKRAVSHGKRPPPRCHNWMIAADRRESLGGQTLPDYKVVCGSHR